MANLCRASIGMEPMAKKLQLSYKDIESRLEVFKTHAIPTHEVGYELLKAFGKSERDVERYKEGKGVLKTFGGLLIKGLFCYVAVDTLHLTEKLESLKQDAQVVKAAPKILAVSDGNTLLAFDTRENDTYEQQLTKIHSDFTFFYPLMNVERIHNVEESPADVKAAEKLAKLHDEIRAYNEFNSDDDLHDLNIFITRLLFCFFAEDTGIFEANLFSNFIKRYTKSDGSDLSDMIGQAFSIMNVKLAERSEDITKEINAFPYVNGGLFATDIPIPKMSYKARKIIIACGDLDWKDINPDIFGSMIQAVVNPDVRAKEGMHYTSVPNIMKVINPLFMDDLRAEYKKLVDAYDQKKNMLDLGVLSENQFLAECKPIIAKCDRLLLRMSKMKFLDPACGSGNFLIITYKQLRLLEMDILRLRKKCEPNQMIDFIDGSCIRLTQFYGIELLDFPHEVAMLSLWLAEHQMNNKFHTDFGVNVAALPLHKIDQIICANACRVDWNEVCPHTKEEEVFAFGNPPYLGSRRQDADQKEDMQLIFKKDFGELDYISCWFVKGALYITNTKAQYAFVSTNSICQGLQVALLWKKIMAYDLSISYAYQSFKWSNNAKHNAGVTCVIVGVASNGLLKNRVLFKADKQYEVKNISPLLIDSPTVFVESQTKPITSIFPPMNFGNMPADGGKLILSDDEKNELISKYPLSEKFILPLIGAEEFINGKSRWCLWLYGKKKEEYEMIPEIARRIEELREIRKKSSRPQLAEIPHLFAQITQPLDCAFILIPCHSSENRHYIPIGYLEEGNIAHNSTLVIGTNEISLFGILTSEMHMTWVRTVGGRLETRYRYSAGLCYNTFPFPSISDAKKSEIEEVATQVLIARESHPDKTLADLYDPEKMPSDLREAHEALDAIVESCYPGAPFANDEARLECLFKLYEKMTAKK